VKQHNANVILYSFYYARSCDKTLPTTVYANISIIHLSCGLLFISIRETSIKNDVVLVTNNIRYVIIICFKTPYSSDTV